MTFIINKIANIKVKNPILIEGLPGIGNVGKIAVDFIIDNLKAKKIIEIYSYKFPHAVFVNEKNLVELPTISMYHTKSKKQDILLLGGDIQPIDEVSCYEFCEKVLDILEEMKGKEIITIGGIGFQQIPKKQEVFCTANTQSILKKYKSKNLRNDIYGTVGPIIGVSGLLLGLSAKRNIPAIALLASTFGHPSYLGIKGAREVLKILNENLKLNLNIKQLDTEIDEIEREIKTRGKIINQLQSKKQSKKQVDTNYIG